MQLLQKAGAAVSLGLIAAGAFPLWKFGLSSSSVAAFMGGAVSGFALSLTLYVFELRRRIAALERAVSSSSQPGR
jgi:hypothetical protein